jgi:multiple antibiotic resistance protein
LIPHQALFVTQLLTLWAVLDPVSHLPLFMTATTGLDAAGKRKAAIASVLFAFLILTFFGFVGQVLLHAMSISLLSFQIAGGIILLLFAIHMVLGQATPTHQDGPAMQPRESPLSVAVYPLATPIIAGPGAILSIVLLMDNNRLSFAQQTTTLAAMALALAGLLAIFMIGAVVERIIRAPGIQLLRRVMGLLLAALAVNLVLTALARWLNLPSI